MKTRSPGCKKKQDLPEGRLRAFKSNIPISCPACKGDVEIRDPSDGEDLKKKILATVEDLPPMPQVVRKAQQVLSNPHSSFSELTAVIEADQAIATSILRMANSAYYGSAGRVSSVRQASVLFGTKILMELLNLACASSPLSQTLKGYDLESGDLWRHSLAVAAGSRIIAEKRNPGGTDDAFSAGLIHDVGKLVLDQYIFQRGEVFRKILQRDDESFLSAEKEVLGFDHPEIAAEICDKWRIPSFLTQAIRHHHEPSASKDNALAYVIHVADVTAMMTGIGGGLDALRYRIDDRALRFLEIGHEDLTLLMEDIAEYVEEIAGNI